MKPTRAIPRLRSGLLVDGERSRTKARGSLGGILPRTEVPVLGVLGTEVSPDLYRGECIKNIFFRALSSIAKNNGTKPI